MYAISLQGEPEPLIIDRSGRGLGRGATATVYPASLPGRPPLAAKIFNDGSSMDPRRLRCLLENDPFEGVDTGRSGFSFAWPLALVSPNRYAQSAEGFLMPRVDLSESFHLSACFSSPLRKSAGAPHWPLNIRLLVAARICAALDLLHRKGFIVSDFKPENIRVKKNGDVFFLDCDSYGVASGPSVFPPSHFSAGYIAPELLLNNLGPDKATTDQDLFALGVVIFKLLNYGIHPFQGVLQHNIHAESDDDKVRQALYPYGLTTNPKIAPSPTSIHSFFPNELRAAFDAAFLTIPASGSTRPSAASWGTLLGDFVSSNSLQRCDLNPNSVDHIRFAGMPCAVCKLSAIRSRQTIPAKSSQTIVSNSGAASTTSTGTLSPPAATPNFKALIAGVLAVVVCSWLAATCSAPEKSTSYTYPPPTAPTPAPTPVPASPTPPAPPPAPLPTPTPAQLLYQRLPASGSFEDAEKVALGKEWIEFTGSLIDHMRKNLRRDPANGLLIFSNAPIAPFSGVDFSVNRRGPDRSCGQRLRDSWKCVRSGRDLQCDEDSQIRDDSETICLERLLK